MADEFTITTGPGTGTSVRALFCHPDSHPAA
jgi:hypothetical protein